MSFLEPLMLVALPLVGLPLLIHLINQRRYQTVRWGAMMFLLAAQRMSRGYARLRQWLILLARMLVIAGLIFVLGRPLASGWLGLTAGGGADTTIILLDRSPSMQQREAGATVSKLDAGRRQLADTLALLGSSRWVLIENTTNQPRELQAPSGLLELPCTEATGAEADLPAMLQAARDYIQANRTGRTEIWICSDLRENDWHADSGRWQTLRESFSELTQGVRFHLLAYPQVASGNTAVRVTGARRQQSGQQAELLVSLQLSREGGTEEKIQVPLELEIEGARSELTIEMTGPQYELKDHRIPLEGKGEQGWGRVSIPVDTNPADNEFYFVFGKPVPRKAILVAEDPQVTWPLELATSISPDPAFACAAEVVPVEQLASVAWEEVALLVWQARLPQGSAAELIQAFVGRGGQAIFLPPRSPGEEELFGVRWGAWEERGKETAVETWRGDQDLLAHALSGESLPVGDLQIRRACQVLGDVTTLATLRGGAALLARVTTDRGGVYFWATTPASADSSLASDAVVLYVAVQRAMAAGAEVLGNTRNLVAGRPPLGIPTPWNRQAGADRPLSTDYPFYPGVYTAGERLLAVNRVAGEDQAAVLDDGRAATLFRGLDFSRMDDHAGNATTLVQEVWRMFLTAMIVAMVCEAGLCLPKKHGKEGAAS